MVDVVCPNCLNRNMTQDKANLRNLACSKCGKFMLLPTKPSGKDIPDLWDYLIQAGKHIRAPEKTRKM